jgi:transmembrane sensor
MSNVRELPTVDDTIIDQSAVWVAKVDRGLSPKEERELSDWLSASALHRREFLESSESWSRMDALSRLADVFPEPSVSRVPRVFRGGLAIAASILIVVAVGVSWLGIGEVVIVDGVSEIAAESIRRYETAVGEQSEFELSDGTKLVLNTDSAVLVDFTRRNRFLTLERGEINVRVAHEERALSVMVGDKVVQAVGTAFNIEITADQNVELVVTEGIVLIGVLDAPIHQLPPDQPLMLGASAVFVASGSEVAVRRSGVISGAIESKSIEAEEIAVRLSWRSGNLIFRGESLEEAVKEIGRYTEVEFVFLDESAKRKRVTGFFKAGDVDGLLAALRKNFKVSFEWSGKGKIFLSDEE